MPKFGAASKRNLAEAHPLLQQLFNEVIKDANCTVLDAQRGRKAQELAFAQGHSKAHFGDSAHNYVPAVALDVVPYPLDWNDLASFRTLAAMVKIKAKQLSIPIQWGGDWKGLVDMPHYELSPWRDWAKKSKLIKG
jgi:peptidoglycan L-alanyl-D-glutamate endopeptidase CwlK